MPTLINIVGFAIVIGLLALIRQRLETLTWPKPSIIWKVTVGGGLTIEGESIRMNLKNTQQARVTANFTNRLGGPAQIQPGTATFTAQAATGAFTVEPDPNNELSCIVKANPQSPGGPDDVGIVHLEVDGDTGDGVKPLVAELAVNITAGDADILELEAGTPEEQV